MYKFNGRYVYIEELTTENDKLLFELMKDQEKEYRFFVSDQSVPKTYEEIQKELKEWFSGGRNFQFLVFRKKDNKLIGTFFFYGWNEKEKSIKLSVYFVPEIRKSILTGEALGAAVLFAKDILKIENLLFDVYIENKAMIELAKKIGANFITEKCSAVNPERKVLSFVCDKKRINR